MREKPNQTNSVIRSSTWGWGCLPLGYLSDWGVYNLRAESDFKGPSLPCTVPDKAGAAWPASATSPPGLGVPCCIRTRLRLLTAPTALGGLIHREIQNQDWPEEKQCWLQSLTVSFNFKRNLIQESGDFTSPWPSSWRTILLWLRELIFLCVFSRWKTA